MKRIPHITLLSVLTLLLVMAACKDKKPNTSSDPCTTCQSVLEAKEYFLFKVGSWWVYEEETTHERDSMYVTEANNDPNSYGFDIRIKSALTGYEYHYWPVYYQAISGCSTTLPVNKKCLYVKRGKGKFQDNLGESNVFFVKYKIGDFSYTGSELNYCPDSRITIVSIKDSFVVGQFTFQKTVRIDEDCCFQEGKQPTVFYHSKNIGIVRKEFIDSNQVWNLVNYYIAP